MMASMMAIINPGDEVVVFEPFYENYGPDAILSGATPRFVKLQPPDWTFDRDELAAAFGPHTKAIILNTPNNPTGKVFTRAELEFIRDLCVRWNAFCHHRRNLRAHPLRRHRAHLHGRARRHARPHHHHQRHVQDLQRHRLARRLGHRSARSHASHPQGPRLPDRRRRRSACRKPAPSPCSLPQSYYDKLAATYAQSATACSTILESAGFTVFKPRGAYYIMTDISRLKLPAKYRSATESATSASPNTWSKKSASPSSPAPASTTMPQDGATQVRFTFCKKEETLPPPKPASPISTRELSV